MTGMKKARGVRPGPVVVARKAARAYGAVAVMVTASVSVSPEGEKGGWL